MFMKHTAPAALLLALLLMGTGLLAAGAAAATPQSHSITAVVVNGEGVQLQGVKIVVSNSTVANGTSTSYTGYTNSSGLSTIKPLESGNYTVTASLAGYAANTTYHINNSYQNITVSFIMIQLKGNITGFITAGSTPVANATVDLTNSSVLFETHSSAPLGSYTFAGIPNGTYSLSATLSGYIGKARNVTVSAGVLRWYNITLKPTLGILAGVVNSTAQNGKNGPLRDANVTVTGPEGILRTKTNANGYYFFSNLTSGTYNVSVQDTGFSPGLGTVTITLARTSYLNFTLIPLSRKTPFTIPGFIGNLDLDHSLVIVALIIIMVSVTGSMALLNRSFNWKEERETMEKDPDRKDGKN